MGIIVKMNYKVAVPFDEKTIYDAYDWCANNLRYSVWEYEYSGLFTFVDDEDAVRFALKWA